MKAKLCLLVAIFLAGCGLFGGPTSTVKKYMANAEKGDVDTMNSLFSAKAMQQLGLEKIRSNNQNFSDMVRRVIAGGGKPKMNQISEVVTGNKARVTFVYQDNEKNSSISMGFDISKEGGGWKIDNIGGRDATEPSEVSSPSHGDSPKEETKLLVPMPSPPEAGSSSSPLSAPPPRAPISGGVLNTKAISLPQPAYPPIGRAVKASGTVVVQVLVDENGNVVSATAVSGHPLLLAGCIAAARGAKFPPAKLSGQPVKVSGTIIYKFDAPQ